MAGWQLDGRGRTQRPALCRPCSIGGFGPRVPDGPWSTCQHARHAWAGYKVGGSTEYNPGTAASRVSQPQHYVRRTPTGQGTSSLTEHLPRYRVYTITCRYMRTATPFELLFTSGPGITTSGRTIYLCFARILHLQRPCTASAST